MIRSFPARAVLSVMLPALITISHTTYADALNDTGITDCADNSSNSLPCPVAGFPRQDAQVGRDAAWKAGKLKKIGGGHAGFDYTRVDATGKSLPASATTWACVRDNDELSPVLQKAFQSHAPGDAVFQASGDALASMGLAQATEVLLQWAEQAPDEAKPYAQQWFSRVRDEASLRVLRTRMLDAKPFRSRAVRDGVNAVRETLETGR